MNKRQLFVVLSVGSAGLALLIASGADVNLGSLSKCVGIASLPHWLDEACRPALVPRLLILAVGLVPAVLLWYFAEKALTQEAVDRHVVTLGFINPTGHCRMPDCEFSTDDRWLARAHSNVPGDMVIHRVREDDTKQSTLHFCLDCPFESTNSALAIRHKAELIKRTHVSDPPKPPQTRNAHGFADPPQAKPAPPSRDAASEFKTCPDCAEQVRSAARKCRFCGYMFESVDSPTS